MSSEAIKKAYRTPEEWRILAEQQQIGKVEIAEFCEVNNLPLKSFYHWRAKLGYSTGKRGGFRKKSVTSSPEVRKCNTIDTITTVNNNVQITHEIDDITDHGELNQQEREHRQKSRDKLHNKWITSQSDRLLAVSSINQDSAAALQAYRELVKERKEKQYMHKREAELYHLEK